MNKMTAIIMAVENDKFPDALLSSNDANKTNKTLNSAYAHKIDSTIQISFLTILKSKLK